MWIASIRSPDSQTSMSYVESPGYQKSGQISSGLQAMWIASIRSPDSQTSMSYVESPGYQKSGQISSGLQAMWIASIRSPDSQTSMSYVESPGYQKSGQISSGLQADLISPSSGEEVSADGNVLGASGSVRVGEVDGLTLVRAGVTLLESHVRKTNERGVSRGSDVLMEK
ncbi:uncharacterized protein [Macrobrachium rosenbergii]|uniref:uncharacterized protein n=1 Tax=Macrobrachium rosenbergii TaxID=79674 RepID=UPI0034D77401